jgi:hypothetical protein
MEKPKSRARRKFLINPKFQWRMIAYCTLALLVFNSLMIGGVSFIYNLSSHEILSDPSVQASKLAPIVSHYKSMIFIFLGTLNVLSLATVAFLSLLYSNKIAGPIYRLNLYFENAAQCIGKNKELSFRQGDYFSEIPESVNAYLFMHDLIALEDEPPQFNVVKKAS